MPPAKKKQTKQQAGKQSSLAGAGMYPVLSKMSVAIGLFCLVPGDFCPESDKQKKYKCIVTEFIGMHTFSAPAPAPAPAPTE